MKEFFFDLVNKVNTRGVIDLTDLDIRHESIANARRYQGISINLFKKAISSLNCEDWSEYTFIDFGAGKGRAMILASMMQFARVIGIEFANDLCEICQNNIDSYKKSNPSLRSSIEIINLDARDYKIESPTKNLFYFYNPFDGKIMTEVLQGILTTIRCSSNYNEESKTANNYFVYINPRQEFVFHLMGLSRIVELADQDLNRAVHIYV